MRCLAVSNAPPRLRMHGATISEVPAAGSKWEPRGFQGVVSHHFDPFWRSVDSAFGPRGDPGKVFFPRQPAPLCRAWGDVGRRDSSFVAAEMINTP